MRLLHICLLALATTGACSHYAIRVPDTEQEKPVSITLPDSLSVATQKIENYLKARQHYSSTYRPIERTEEVRINEEWIRDTSLRYYLRLWDQRLRHVTTWRAQWVLREIPPHRTELRVKVLELLFIGLPQDSEEGPDLDNKTSWFEGDPDEIRSAVEIRRFWTSVYPTVPLPEALSIKVPGLVFEPGWKQDLRRFWKAEPRPRAF